MAAESEATRRAGWHASLALTGCRSRILRFLRSGNICGGRRRPTSAMVNACSGEMRRDLHAHGPAHDSAREEIEDDGQVQPALLGPEIGNVVHPRRVGR